MEAAAAIEAAAAASHSFAVGVASAASPRVGIRSENGGPASYLSYMEYWEARVRVSMDFVIYASPLTLPPPLLAWLSFFSNGKSNQLSTQLRIIMIGLGSNVGIGNGLRRRRLLFRRLFVLSSILLLNWVGMATGFFSSHGWWDNARSISRFSFVLLDVRKLYSGQQLLHTSAMNAYWNCVFVWVKNEAANEGGVFFFATR